MLLHISNILMKSQRVLIQCFNSVFIYTPTNIYIYIYIYIY